MRISTRIKLALNGRAVEQQTVVTRQEFRSRPGHPIETRTVHQTPGGNLKVASDWKTFFRKTDD